MVYFWLWVGVIGMGVGCVLLFFRALNNKRPEDQADLNAHFLVPAIAFSLYLLMALGGGVMETYPGHLFYYGRYIDWVFTTPLLLWSLVSAGLQGTGGTGGAGDQRSALVWTLLAADVYMIITGFVAGLCDGPALKWCFYALSWLGFLAIGGMVFGPLRRIAHAGPNGADYSKKAGVLALLWLAYPFVFILGQEGVQAWSAGIDSLLFAVLDVSAKVLYGLWAVALLAKSQPQGGYATATTGAASTGAASRAGI